MQGASTNGVERIRAQGEVSDQLVVRNTFLEYKDPEVLNVRRPRSNSHSGSSSKDQGNSCDSPRSTSHDDEITQNRRLKNAEQSKLKNNSDSDGEDAPLEEMGELPSLGSAKHQYGTCQPCCFYNRENSKKCFGGKDCPYCHLPHEKQMRPGKKSRERARRRQQLMLHEVHQREDRALETSPSTMEKQILFPSSGSSVCSEHHSGSGNSGYEAQVPDAGLGHQGNAAAESSEGLRTRFAIGSKISL